METRRIDFNRKKFVDNFDIISIEEYKMLPSEVQMAYANHLYGYTIQKAKSKGKAFTYNGYVHPNYKSYFEENGCTVENYDFGIEEYEVKCVSPNKHLEISEEAKDKLDFFLTVLGTAKADAFESVVRRNNISREYEDTAEAEMTYFYDPRVLRLSKAVLYENAVTSNELNDEEKKMIMQAELALIVEELRTGNDFDTTKLSEAYQEVLSEMLDSENIAREDSKQLKVVAK